MIIFAVAVLWPVMAVAQAPDSASWRNVFSDSLLVELIETALENNADLNTAMLNVQQADAALGAARLSHLPEASIGVEGGVSKTKGSSASYTYNMPLTMQWEADIAGRIKGEKRAALAAYMSATEAKQAVRLQLISSVASHYYMLLMMDEQLAITRQSIEVARQTVEVMEAMKDVGMQNEAAVSQARVAWLNIATSENNLLRQIRSTENALAVVLGEQRDSIARAGSWNMTLPIDGNAAYPVFCLAWRPDVRMAEYALKEEVAGVDVAKAAFYPSLNISASLGWTNNLGQIINPGQMLLNAIGSLVQPLFNKGKNRANLRIAEARQQQALVAFNQALLVAGTELKDALDACRLSQQRLQLREQEVNTAQRAYDVTIELMRNSSSTYLEVLTAQDALLQSRLALASDRLDLIQGQINLFKAVGGNTSVAVIDEDKN
jgi:NodT family efflux transporter outer membrane factor (OMF) lipoprotein